jgi:hypothetical protein
MKIDEEYFINGVSVHEALLAVKTTLERTPNATASKERSNHNCFVRHTISFLVPPPACSPHQAKACQGV